MFRPTNLLFPVADITTGHLPMTRDCLRHQNSDEACNCETCTEYDQKLWRRMRGVQLWSWTGTACWTEMLNWTDCDVLTTAVLTVLPVTDGCGGAVTVGLHLSSKTSQDSPLSSAGCSHRSVTLCPLPSRNALYTLYILSQSHSQGLPATSAQQSMYKLQDISSWTLNTPS